jgi:hypothetical protein
MTDQDLHAFGLPAGKRPPRRVRPWWLLAALAVLAVWAVLSVGSGFGAWIDAAQQGVHIRVDGDSGPGMDFSLPHGAMALGGLALGLSVLLVALALALLVLPCALLLLIAAVLALAGLGVAGGLVAAMAVALLIGAAVLTPILLPLWLLWRLLRS